MRVRANLSCLIFEIYKEFNNGIKRRREEKMGERRREKRKGGSKNVLLIRSRRFYGALLQAIGLNLFSVSAVSTA